METMKIKAILAAAKYQTLSRAAEDFSYTPSALSHMADAFEEELGVKLPEDDYVNFNGYVLAAVGSIPEDIHIKAVAEQTRSVSRNTEST